MWLKTKEFFRRPVIRNAAIMGVATGISIVATAWVFKKIIHRPVPTKAELFMAFVLCGYTVGQAYRKKIPWMGKA